MSYEILNRLMDSWQDLREIVVYWGKVASVILTRLSGIFGSNVTISKQYDTDYAYD